MRAVIKGANYPNVGTLSTPGTVKHLGSGATTFVDAVSYITVAHTDKDVYLAPADGAGSSLPGASTAATGMAGDRIFVKADTRGLTIPWAGRDVYFLNATTGETPTIHVIGHV